MTSIAGVISPRHQHSGEKILAAMLDGLPGHGGGHRAIARRGSAVLGRTLSIRTREDRFDRSPMTDDRYALVADVRLDNRDELAVALDLDLHNTSDSSLLFACWRKWGETSLDRICGDFAFAVHDSQTATTWLVRDPGNRRPLLWANSGDVLLFGSMPTALLASRLIRPEFNLDRLAKQLMSFAAVSDDTPFREIRSVLGGTLVRHSPSETQVIRYWNPTGDPLAGPDEVFDEDYRRLFDRAVERMCRRDHGEIGVHLSSGFDSSGVAASAARGRTSVHAYTSAPRIDYDGDGVRNRLSDESFMAGLTAEALGLTHHVIRSNQGVLEILRRDSRIYQEPDRNVVNQPWWQEILRSARNDRVTTLLTGALGNLTIHYGGLYSLAEWRRERGIYAWACQALSARRMPTVRWRGILFNSFESVLPAFLRKLLERAFQGAPTDAQTFLGARWKPLQVRLEKQEEAFFNSGTPHEQRLSLIQMCDAALFTHGVLAVFGIDERDPTSNRPLMEFSLRLPPEQLLKNGVARPMMQRVLTDRLPAEVLANPYRGQQTADWHEHLDPDEALGLVEEVEESPTLQALIDFPKLRRAIADWPTGNWGNASVTLRYRRMIPLTLSIAVFVTEFEEMIRTGNFRHPCQ